MSGVNHFLWLQEISVDGVPFLPQLEQWLIEHREEILKDDYIWRTLSAAKIDFMLKHGVMPIGDTMHWTGAEWPWWYRSSPEVRGQYNEKVPDYGWNHLAEWTSEQSRRFEDWAKDERIRISQVFPPTESDELMVPLIESIAFDIPRTLVLNVMNSEGNLPNMPRAFQIEAPVNVSGAGIKKIQMPPLPRHILAHVYRDRVAPVEMELAAYQEHRRDFLIELILMDKFAVSLKQAEDFVDEILGLPWNFEMKAHYQ